MKRFIRYGVFPIGIFFLLLIVTIILIPIMVNVQKFVPEIEKQVSEATGRSFSLGPDLGISFFPWLSIAFSDMKIGNPPGFISDEFIKVRTFEARIKVLPLLRKQIQISRFVVGGLSINLEKNDSGRVNWEFPGEAADGKRSEESVYRSLGPLSKNLSFALLAVTDGQVKWIDRTQNVQHRVEDIMLLFNDFTPGQPVSLDCKATFNGRQIALEGKVGPFLEKESQIDLPLDIAINVVNKLRGKVRGKLSELEKGRDFEVSVNLSPFSLRDFFSASDYPFPLSTNDSETFRTVSMEFTVRGDREKLTIEKGIAHLDDSNLEFSLLVQDFKGPQVEFALDLDRVDLERYLPPAAVAQGESTENHAENEGDAADRSKSLGDLVLTGVIQVGEMKIHGATVNQVYLPLRGKEGVFTVAPATLKTGRGQIEGSFTLDAVAAQPTLQVNLKGQELDGETLVREFFGKSYLRGTLSADVVLQSVGDSFIALKKNLGGKASLLLRDGALVGAHPLLPETFQGSQNTVVAGVSDETESAWTDFTEAKSVVTLEKGIISLSETNLTAADFNLQLSGTADIARQHLDLLMETSFVKTVIGKGGRVQKVDHSSLYLISGPFSQPELTDRKVLPSGSGADGKTSVKHLVARKLPSPIEDDVKNLVGKDLVDPAVVALRFRLQPETLRRNEVKKKLPVGSGRVHIGTLREEMTLR